MFCDRCPGRVPYLNSSNCPCSYASLPRLDITSTISNIDHLTNSDIDIHMPSDLNFNYFTTHDFHANEDIINCLTSNSLSFLNCNIRGLQANFDNLVNMLSELYFPISVLGVTETKLKNDQDALLNINIIGYNFLSQPSTTNAGGVGFYVKDNLVYTHRSDLSTQKHNDYESLWIEIHNKKGHNTICGIFYRHPHGNVDNFLNYINVMIEKIQDKYCVLLGDFNLDLLKFESHPDTDSFLSTLGTFYFQPQILQPTRITNHSATLIDNIFFNSLEHFVICGNLCYDLTDHLPNFLIVSKLSSLPASTKVFRRDYSNLDKEILIRDIQSIDWNGLIKKAPDPSSMFDNFYIKLSEVVDLHVPVKQLSKQDLKAQSKPWITCGIRTSIRIKNGLYKKFLKTKSIYYHTKFKIYRNKLNHLIKLAKTNYYNKFFSVHVNNGKRIWYGIKQIVQVKTHGNQHVNKIVIDDREIVDQESIANVFNEFFANIGSNLASSIPSVTHTAGEYMPSPFCDSLFLSPVTANEIELEIAKLNASKAVGPSSIPIVILKILKYQVL